MEGYGEHAIYNMDNMSQEKPGLTGLDIFKPLCYFFLSFFSSVAFLQGVFPLGFSFYTLLSDTHRLSTVMCNIT